MFTLQDLDVVIHGTLEGAVVLQLLGLQDTDHADDHLLFVRCVQAVLGVKDAPFIEG